MAVLDLSNHDLPIDPKCFKEAGVTGVIMGVFHRDGPEVMRKAAQSLRDAGIEILGFYGLPYFGSPYGERRDIDWAIQSALQFGVRRVWIDAEVDSAPFGFADERGTNPSARIAVIRELVARIRSFGLEPGIYSAPWWWKPEVLNTGEFRDLPLWFANYGKNDGTLPPFETLPEPFGGWTKPAVHQYTSTFSVCGDATRDANHVLEETMTPQQFQAEFHKNMALFFPAYIEAYYSRGFTVRNGRLDPGETSDPGPLDHGGAKEADVVAAFEAATKAFKNALLST